MNPVDPKDLPLSNLLDELAEVVMNGRYSERPGNKHPGGNITVRGCDVAEEVGRRLKVVLGG